MNKLKDVSYYIDDNFVPKDIQDELELSLLNDQYFPWYYTEKTVSQSNLKSSHNLFEKEHFFHSFITDGEITTDHRYKIRNLIKLLPEKDRLFRVKTNMMFQDKDGDPNAYNTPHYDYEWEKEGKRYQKNFYVALYYCLDSDGDTFIFDKDEKVIDRISPKKGRMVFMRGDILHASRHPIKSKRRLVINMDIFPNEV